MMVSNKFVHFRCILRQAWTGIACAPHSLTQIYAFRMNEQMKGNPHHLICRLLEVPCKVGGVTRYW